MPSHAQFLLREGVSLGERWWRRRKEHPWFSDLFDEFNGLEEMTDEIIKKAFGNASERPKIRRTCVYGFSVSFGPDWKPVVREFGNLQPSRRGPKIQREREPPVDVIEEDKALIVVVELLGVEKEDINLHVIDKHLTISVDTPNRKYHKVLTLPARVEPKSAGATYKNGVLEIKLKKWKHQLKAEKISVKEF